MERDDDYTARTPAVGEPPSVPEGVPPETGSVSPVPSALLPAKVESSCWSTFGYSLDQSGFPGQVSYRQHCTDPLLALHQELCGLLPGVVRNHPLLNVAILQDIQDVMTDKAQHFPAFGVRLKQLKIYQRRPSQCDHAQDPAGPV